MAGVCVCARVGQLCTCVPMHLWEWPLSHKPATVVKVLSNKCLTTSNKKLLGTSASLLVCNSVFWVLRVLVVPRPDPIPGGHTRRDSINTWEQRVTDLRDCRCAHVTVQKCSMVVFSGVNWLECFSLILPYRHWVQSWSPCFTLHLSHMRKHLAVSISIDWMTPLETIFLSNVKKDYSWKDHAHRKSHK